jgi:epoxyqueuosine reductase
VSPTPAELAARVKATGRRLGFDAVAVGPAAPPEHGAAFEAWLDAGHAGTMDYLGRGRRKRRDPGLVLPGARSVVAAALNYYQDGAAGPAHVARYAWGRDYHDVLEPRLRALQADLEAAAPGTRGRAYVDTGPLLERELAAGAGLGWVGKNTMLIHPALGSFFFIGVVRRAGPRSPDRRPVRDLHPLPGGVPHRRVRGRVRPGRAALHRLPDDRAPRPDPGDAPRSAGRARVRL